MKSHSKLPRQSIPSAYEVVCFDAEEIARDPVLAGMVRDGILLTRANYIERGWPDNWDKTFWGELPDKFQGIDNE